MVRVMPFRGLRYDAAVVGDWGAMLGPPYDIVNAVQAAALIASSPYQIAHIETASGDAGISAAARRLRDWRAAGAMLRDERTCFYLHEHRFVAHGREQTRRALFAAVELSPLGEAGVVGHERTMSGPKATRTALRSLVGADVSPLMAFVPDQEGIVAELIDAVALAPPSNGGIDPAGDAHTLRVIDDPQSVAAIESAFASQRIYIADGHHRYESALASQDDRPGSRSVLMGILCASDSALAVGATHRVVHAAVPARLHEQLCSFVRRPRDRSQRPGRCAPGRQRNARPHHDRGRVHPGTDGGRACGDPRLRPVHVAEVCAGPPAVRRARAGVRNRRAVARLGARPSRIRTTWNKLLDSVQSGSASAAFILPAPTLQDVVDTADAGGFMPPEIDLFRAEAANRYGASPAGLTPRDHDRGLLPGGMGLTASRRLAWACPPTIFRGASQERATRSGRRGFPETVL